MEAGSSFALRGGSRIARIGDRDGGGSRCCAADWLLLRALRVFVFLHHACGPVVVLLSFVAAYRDIKILVDVDARAEHLYVIHQQCGREQWLSITFSLQLQHRLFNAKRSRVLFSLKPPPPPFVGPRLPLPAIRGSAGSSAKASALKASVLQERSREPSVRGRAAAPSLAGLTHTRDGRLGRENQPPAIYFWRQQRLGNARAGVETRE